MQKIRDLKPKVVYMFAPNGPPSIGFVKAFAAYGLGADGAVPLGFADEADLPSMGEAAVGVTSLWHYSPDLPNAQNQAFVAAYKKKYGENEVPNFQVAATYDAMHAIADVVKKLDRSSPAIRQWRRSGAGRPTASVDPSRLTRSSATSFRTNTSVGW